MTGKFVLSVGILAGTIIGAGIFALPYTLAQVGVWHGLLYLLVLSVIMVLIHLAYAEVVLNTNGKHNFVGYARLYLGKWGSWAGILITVVQMVLVLVIYLVLSQSFIRLILGSESALWHLILFWAVGSAAVFLTLKKLAWLELLVVAGMAGIIFLIFWAALPALGVVSLNSAALSWKNFLIPIGPILFALAGRVAIVEAVRQAGRARGRAGKKAARLAVILGTLIPAVVYALFVLAVVALSPLISKDAVSGLIGYLPPMFLTLIGILGWLSLWSSYVAIGFDVNDILRVDLGQKSFLRILIIIILPLIIYLAGLKDFILLVSLTGGVFLVLESLLIIWMFVKTKN